MQNGEIITVRRKSDGAVFSVGDYLKRNGDIKIIRFEYLAINDCLVAVFPDNKIGIDGLRKNEIAKK